MEPSSSQVRFRRFRVASIAMVAALVLVGCGSGANEEDDPIIPEVEGLTLEIARSDIERAGYEDDIEILGGGTFGTVNEANWEVCSQLPAAGEPIDIEPRLTVDRSCDDGAEEPEETDLPEPDAEATEPSADETSTLADDTTGEEDDATSESPDLEEESLAGTDATAEDVEAMYLAHLGNPADGFSVMCDDYYTHWSCFYDGVEGDPSSYLQVNLTTDGGWLDSEISDMADTAGLHWFNFIGCDFPEITTIVININGLDHNIFRFDVPDLCS